ncbi:hypothetical protein BASA81_012363 [Batrachochytrium salamandrivorans]|nr:hypothetical protein BASA81_012363 [Batrachochytrium salamandrivorans]
MAAERGETVFLVLDCSEPSWAKANDSVAPSKRSSFMLALESTILLQNAIKLFHADNETVLVAACHPYPQVVAESSSKQDFFQLSEQTGLNSVSITKSLMIALCVANKQRGAGDNQIRFVLITASPVPTLDFVTCMNCAFAAQKLGVVIDVFDFSQASDSPTLMQLVHHTNGWYVNVIPEQISQGILAHTLLSYFTASPQERTIGPPQLATDMRSHAKVRYK